MSFKRRVMVCTAAILLPLLGYLIWDNWPASNPSLGKVLTKMGYVELSPPSRLFPPGTITTVETLPNGSHRLHLTCMIEEDALKPFWAISSTIEQSERWKIENAFKASTQALQALISTMAANKLNKVNIALHNMTIVSISNEGMIMVRRGYLKDSCEEAVIWNLQAEAAVCQVGEVLQADLYYKMSGEESVAVSQKLDISRDIVAEIENPAEATMSTEIRAKGLYLGVRVNLYCFRLIEDQLVGTIMPTGS